MAKTPKNFRLSEGAMTSLTNSCKSTKFTETEVVEKALILYENIVHTDSVLYSVYTEGKTVYTPDEKKVFRSNISLLISRMRDSLPARTQSMYNLVILFLERGLRGKPFLTPPPPDSGNLAYDTVTGKEVPVAPVEAPDAYEKSIAQQKKEFDQFLASRTDL